MLRLARAPIHRVCRKACAGSFQVHQGLFFQPTRGFAKSQKYDQTDLINDILDSYEEESMSPKELEAMYEKERLETKRARKRSPNTKVKEAPMEDSSKVLDQWLELLAPRELHDPRSAEDKEKDKRFANMYSRMTQRQLWAQKANENKKFRKRKEALAELPPRLREAAHLVDTTEWPLNYPIVPSAYPGDETYYPPYVMTANLELDTSNQK